MLPENRTPPLHLLADVESPDADDSFVLVLLLPAAELLYTGQRGGPSSTCDSDVQI